MMHAALERKRTRRVRVTVDLVLDDLGTAYCVDSKGYRYTIDRRSAVSISALAEGMQLDVNATPGGLVTSLAFEGG